MQPLRKFLTCLTLVLSLWFWHAYTQAQEFTFVAVGDIMLSRGVGTQICKHGSTFPFEPTVEILRRVDVTFANLEAQISTLGEPVKNKEIHFRADPKSVYRLMYAGVDVVSLSNNHALDYGSNALFDTMDFLAHHGIAYIGAGMNDAAARRSANFICNGVKSSILAHLWDFYLTVEATTEKLGVAVIQRENITQDIKNAKAWADVVIVSFHWGWEYADHPTEEDRKTAYLAIDAGTDLVVGHHPHVVQGVERYQGKLICHSLGNFIFDQKSTRTRCGLILRCNFAKGNGISSAELLPTIIHPKEFRLRMASGRRGNKIYIGRGSNLVGTNENEDSFECH
jgi:poly-gamma-glutamate synthesis protein (capsule biosynthesis protein)